MIFFYTEISQNFQRKLLFCQAFSLHLEISSMIRETTEMRCRKNICTISTRYCIWRLFVFILSYYILSNWYLDIIALYSLSHIALNYYCITFKGVLNVYMTRSFLFKPFTFSIRDIGMLKKNHIAFERYNTIPLFHTYIHYFVYEIWWVFLPSSPLWYIYKICYIFVVTFFSWKNASENMTKITQLRKIDLPTGENK